MELGNIYFGLEMFMLNPYCCAYIKQPGADHYCNDEFRID